MRRLVIGLGIVLLIAAGVAFAMRQRGAAAVAPVAGERVTVRQGSITATVNATGNVEANRQVALNFRTAGTVAEVLVEEGDTVEEGALLARLDTMDLEFAVAQAEANVAAQAARVRQLQSPPDEGQVRAAEAQLESARQSLTTLQGGSSAASIEAARAQLTAAEAALRNLQAGSSADSIAAARADLESTQAGLRALEAGPDPNSLIAAQAELDSAAAAVRQAQAAYDEVAYFPNISSLPQSVQLEQATIQLQAAQARYDALSAGPTEAELEQARANIARAQANLNALLQGPTQSEVASAQAQIEQAQSNLDALLQGPDAGQVAAAQAQIEQAQATLDQTRAGADENDLAAARATLRQTEVSLEQAQANLAGAELRAPFAATVATLGAMAGETVTGAQPMATLVDLSQFRIEVEVDEIDIGQVAVGDPVTISVDSLPGAEIPATIDFIAPTPTIDQGVVTYPVRILLDPDDAPGLRVGMSANVDIVTETREDVLLVPNEAIEIDRDTGQLFVIVVQGDETERREVQIGLRTEEESEISEGLAAGDTLLIPDPAAREPENPFGN